MNIALNSIHWARWLSGAGVLLIIVLTIIVLVRFKQLRRDLAKLKSTGVIDVEAGNKLLEVAQEIGVRQIEHNTKHIDAIEAVRSHLSSNHDEIDGELRKKNELLIWMKARLERLMKLLTHDGKEPPNGHT